MTFVPDGEPTLDKGLGESIKLLRRLRFKIAVISNGSLIWQKAVRENLKLADWVSLKVDSVDESLWRRINRPYEGLELEAILSGMMNFARDFQGVLVTETMLIDRINTTDESVSRLAEFLQKLAPRTAYLSIPIRPPAEENVRAPKEDVLNRIYQTLNRTVAVANVELLTGYEGNAFASTGNAVEDLLAITAVHPMRKDAVMELLRKTHTNWNVVQDLLDEGKLREVEYQGSRFYMRISPTT